MEEQVILMYSESRNLPYMTPCMHSRPTKRQSMKSTANDGADAGHLGHFHAVNQPCTHVTCNRPSSSFGKLGRGEFSETAASVYNTAGDESRPRPGTGT